MIEQVIDDHRSGGSGPSEEDEEKEPLRCQCCGKTKDEDDEVEEVEPGLVLCYSCENEEYTHCSVCERYISQDSARNHRHLFETEHGAWYGTGGMDMGISEYEEVRVSLCTLLDRMGRRFARDLARTIRNNHMEYDNLHTVTGLVLGPVTVFCFLDCGGRTPKGWKRPGFRSYGEKLHEVFRYWYDHAPEDEDEPPFGYGFQWLFGLGDDTPEDNTRTLEWITTWQTKGAIHAQS